MAINYEFQQRDPRAGYYDSALESEAVNAAWCVDDIDQALELLYPADRIARLTQEIIDDSNFYEIGNGRKWAVAVLSNDHPSVDVAKRVENERFSKFFDHHPVQHYIDYGIYDEASVFITVIDTEHPQGPKAASVLRIVRNSEIGLKTINTLSTPNIEENPWYPEISTLVGEYEYDDVMEKAKHIIAQAFGVNPDTTWAIETMAVLEEYAGKKGELGEASFPLYAACLQLSNMAGIESWISIQDLKPLLQMQDIFNNPWEFTSLSVQNYEGEYPTIPAVIPDMNQAQRELRSKDPETASAIIDGEGLSLFYVMPEELHPAGYLEMIAKTYARPR